ncbi:MAG: DegQ family serine endoprotease [Thermodesulfobacteriota bacterium]
METLSFKKPTVWLTVIAMAVLIWGCELTGGAGAAAFGGREGDGPSVPMNFNQLATKAQPGVVNIRTVKTLKGGGPVFRHFFQGPFGDKSPFEEFFGPFSQGMPRDFKQRSLGSGFIIDGDGYIVTNNHVVADADEITVRLANEKEYPAKIVGRDPNTDLALIKIEDAKELTPLKMGDSDTLKVGTWVLAIGSPFGLEQTVTAGIVSAKGRTIGSGPYDDFIQTDASINPGNSGGPLLNLDGEVVGINTAIVAHGQGIGFAIPINMARSVITQLKESGSVTRGWMGVSIQDLTDELSEYYGMKDQKGVLVTQAFEGDPADKAGIKAQDVIVAINGKPVSSSRELSATVAGIAVGEKAKVTVMRDGKRKEFTVTVAKRKDEELLARQAPGDSGGELGLSVVEITPENANRFGHSPDNKGILVMGVQPDSAADKSGVQQGDLITEVNRKPVTTVEEFRKETRAADKKKGLYFLIKRPRMGMLVIKIE